MALLHCTGNRPIKKIIGFLAMLTVTAALYAQAESIPEGEKSANIGEKFANVKVWVAPTTGGSAEDRAYFDFNLPEEVKGSGYELTETQEASDFYIVASLEYDEEYGDYVLTAELYNTETGALIVTTGMGYQTTEEMNDWNLTTIYSLMANAPISKRLSLKAEAPKEYHLFLGLRAGYSMRFYQPFTSRAELYPDPYTLGHTFEAALHLSYQPWRYVGFQTEAIFTMDFAPLKHYNNKFDSSNSVDMAYLYPEETYQSVSLMVPLIVKGIFWIDQLVISPLAGVYLAAPLGQMTRKEKNGYDEAFDVRYQIPLGWTAGAELGIRLGSSHIVFLDVRYAGDFTAIVRPAVNPKILYQRRMISFSLGYKFDLLMKPGQGAQANSQ
ncbi:hypothetical protein AGMMS49579_03310 [Spirochaetia bacterium]|nr:hypothetical protein AGMMS49579_03310 [Spirochaetia bacterium]